MYIKKVEAVEETPVEEPVNSWSAETTTNTWESQNTSEENAWTEEKQEITRVDLFSGVESSPDQVPRSVSCRGRQSDRYSRHARG